MKRLAGLLIIFFILSAAPILAASGVHSGVHVEIRGTGTVTVREETVLAQAAPGSDLIVTLPSNPTTGYTWRLAEGPDEDVLRQSEHRYERPGTDRVGAGGRDIRTFKAVGAGQTRAILEYVRPWEKEKAPAKRINIKIQVSP